MKFDYSAILSVSPDTGDALLVFRPEVCITIHGPVGSQDYFALVDTGADNSVFPESVANDLGIALTPSKGPAAVAFGGQPIMLSYGDVELELKHPDGNVRWTTRVYFLAGSDVEEQTLILGHQGMLEYFTATFIGEEAALELMPNGYLPQIAHGR